MWSALFWAELNRKEFHDGPNEEFIRHEGTWKANAIGVAARYTKEALVSPRTLSMRHFALIGLILSLAIGYSAMANTVPVRRIHRRTHRAGSSVHSNGKPHTDSAQGTTSAARAESKRVTRGQGTHSAKVLPAQLHRPTNGHATTVAARKTATRRQHSTTVQTVRMSHRYPAYRRRASLRTVSFRWVSPLAGSKESLIHQNEMAEAEGLERIQDDADLDNRIAEGALVPVPENEELRVNEDLPENRRYCRPWTADFLRTLAEAHAAEFPRSPLEVTSAVRTVEYQRRLRRINGNAAAADGDLASPHLTGGTIDLAKKGMSRREIAWMRSWLLPLQQAGKIDVEEEFRQACFHISVYKSFVGADPETNAPATTVANGDGVMDAPGH